MNIPVKYKLDETTLAEIYEEITERIFPMMAFRVMKGNELISLVTIPWARFREDEENPELFEVRSSDEPAPTHILYLSKSVLSKYVLKKQDHLGIYYLFEYQIQSEE